MTRSYKINPVNVSTRGRQRESKDERKWDGNRRGKKRTRKRKMNPIQIIVAEHMQNVYCTAKRNIAKSGDKNVWPDRYRFKPY